MFEMARSLLFHAKLPVVFWGEAIKTAIYLMNHRLCVNDKSKTVIEVWSGTKPYISHLKVFGCDAYVHVHQHNRTKMEPKSIKGIFIGYDAIKENGYRVYDVSNKKIIISRDVDFNEHSFTAGRDLLNNNTSASSLSNLTELMFDTYVSPYDKPTSPYQAYNN